MSPIARRQVVVSDLTGKEVDEDEAVQVIFRRGEGIERPVVIDALASEVEDLTDAPGVFVLEIKPVVGNTSTELVVTAAALKKIVPDGDLDALLGKSARPTRGRPPLSRVR